MKPIIRSLFLVFSLLTLSGCNIFQTRSTQADLQRQQQAAREREQRRFYEEQHNSMRSNVEELDGGLYQVRQEIAVLRSELAGEQADDISRIETRIAQLESRIEELDRNRKQDRDEIVETLTKRISDVMKTQAAEAARRQQAAKPARAFEHIVGAGETLSAIASAYNVSQQAIIKVNNLRNPDALRVGQKIAIPR